MVAFGVLGLAAWACADAPPLRSGLDGGVPPDGAAGYDGADDVGPIKPAPADFAPEDWVLFLCPSCPGAAADLLAIRCDGSQEISLGHPVPAAPITSAHLTEGMTVVSTRNGATWSVWARRSGSWSQVSLGVAQAGQMKSMGGPHVDGYFSGRPDRATRFLYARTYDQGTDAVSYFDVGMGVGYDHLGQARPQADDLQIQFTVLGSGVIATYWYSPSGLAPGDRRTLDFFDPETGDFPPGFALEKPEQIVGMRDGNVAVLRGGEVTIYAPGGTVQPSLTFSGPIAALAAVDAGGLAFSSAGDLYCLRTGGNVVRLTETPMDEMLLP